jgi:hypothetical protein
MKWCSCLEWEDEIGNIPPEHMTVRDSWNSQCIWCGSDLEDV